MFDDSMFRPVPPTDEDLENAQRLQDLQEQAFRGLVDRLAIPGAMLLTGNPTPSSYDMIRQLMQREKS